MTRPKKLGAGLVALMAHVEPELRERVRREAKASGVSVSAIVTGALLTALPIMAVNRSLKDWSDEFQRRWPGPGAPPTKAPRHG